MQHRRKLKKKLRSSLSSSGPSQGPLRQNFSAFNFINKLILLCTDIRGWGFKQNERTFRHIQYSPSTVYGVVIILLQIPKALNNQPTRPVKENYVRKKYTALKEKKKDTFSSLLVPRHNMSSVHRPDLAKQASLADGFLCPVNSGPLVFFLCFLSPRLVIFKKLSEGISVLLTRYLENQHNQLFIQSSRERCIQLRGGNRDDYPAFSEGVLLEPFLLADLLLEITAEAAMQATVSLFCLWAKRCFSLHTLEGKK